MGEENPRVNRHLKDRAMDHIDHALGRPVWHGAQGQMLFYRVTGEGRAALAKHLDSVEVDQRHRGYVVTFDRHSRTIPAKSRSHARYAYFQDVRDCLPDLTFGDFIRRSTVRLA